MDQLYFFTVFADTDNLLLTAMAINCYAAIRHPLHYARLMTPCRCALLVGGSWGVAHSDFLIQTLMLTQLSFYTNLKIPHFGEISAHSKGFPALIPTSMRT